MLPLSGQTAVKHRWTNEEKRAVLDHLGRFISLGVVPGNWCREKGHVRNASKGAKGPWAVVHGLRWSFSWRTRWKDENRGSKNNQLALQANKQSCENFSLLRSDKMDSEPKWIFHRHLNTTDSKQKKQGQGGSFQHLSLDGSLYSLLITWYFNEHGIKKLPNLSLIHIWRCRRS